MSRIKNRFLPEEVRKFFVAVGKKSGEKAKQRSLELYGNTSELFRRMAANRKRCGRLPKAEKRELLKQQEKKIRELLGGE